MIVYADSGDPLPGAKHGGRGLLEISLVRWSHEHPSRLPSAGPAAHLVHGHSRVVIEVPADQPTVQSGIASAGEGDTVLVAPGTYYENIRFLGKRIVLASHYILTGDRSSIAATVIDGSSPTDADTASCVVMCSGEDSSTVIQGFTIRGGTGTRWVDPQLPKMTWRGGGGVLIFQASPTVRDNLIIENRVTNTTGVNGAQGGGILTYGGNPLITNNVVAGNEARYGAGIVVDYSGAVITNNIISGNIGGQAYGGGGFWSIGNGPAPIILENNHIVDNAVTGTVGYGKQGGALFIWYGRVTLRNNILWGNTQSSGGPIAQVDGGTALVTYSDVEGGFPGEGNIDQNPEFADAQLHLGVSSPCIDGGDPDSTFRDPQDAQNPGFAGWPSLGRVRNDMGAYGGRGRAELPVVCLTGVTGGGTLDGFNLEQNYPNPFNPSTTIEFALPKSSSVVLTIFNSIGQVVATPLAGTLAEGTHRLCWDASGRPSGVYYYRLTAERSRQIRCMVLVR